MIVAAETLNSRLQLAAIVAAVALAFIVFEMVRQRRLMERYSLLWMAAALILILLAVFSGALFAFADLVGVATPSNALFAFALGFVTFMLLHFSASISRLTNQNKMLAQKLAATEERLRRLEHDEVD